MKFKISPHESEHTCYGYKYLYFLSPLLGRPSTLLVVYEIERSISVLQELGQCMETRGRQWQKSLDFKQSRNDWCSEQEDNPP